jgi:hypothetical protein
MSAGLTDPDTMFSVRETPWHGLGAVLEEPPATVAEAIEASGLGWSVAKEPIAVDCGDKSAADWWVPRCEEIPGLLCHRPPGHARGAGHRRGALQARAEQRSFTFIDQLLGSAIHFETAGSLHGGCRVWVLATLPDHVEVGGDDVRPYVLNSHDGSTAVVAATTPIRVVTGEMRISVWPELAWAPVGLRVAVVPRESGGRSEWDDPPSGRLLAAGRGRLAVAPRGAVHLASG